jgi:ABC-type glycerol-3-phosphate transport system permease component
MSQPTPNLFLKRFMALGGLHSILIILSMSFILPFVWMILASLKPLEQVNSPNWIPEPSPWLTLRDVQEPQRFVNWFTTENREQATYLRQEFSAALIKLLQNYKRDQQLSDTLLASLLNDINAILSQKQLWKELSFQEQTKQIDIKAHSPLAMGLSNRKILNAATGGLLGTPSWFQWQNYLQVFEEAPFARYYWNSILVACWVTFLQVFTSSMAAFSFARLQWKGRDKVFMIYLSTMMLPALVMTIPNYQIMIELGLVDSISGLVIPGAFSAFGTFMLRQFMLGISPSLDEAAEIDGASKWQLYWDIILPLARPGIITLAIFTFMGNYNSFFWPLVMIKSQHLYTLPIGLLYFDSSAGQETNLLMAAVTMSIAPMIIIFIALQKYLVKGIQLGGVKE